MEFKTLTDCPLSTIVACIRASFADYPLEFPPEESYYALSFKKARVDLSLSWGAFHEGELVGVVINGLDERKGEAIAYSKTVGVIPAHRGKRLPDRLYKALFPQLRALGVFKCQLEVIPENPRAIHVYERMGFEATRRWQAFEGRLPVWDLPEVRVRAVDFEMVREGFDSGGQEWDWDYMDRGIIAAGDSFRTYLVEEQGNACGYFVLRPERGFVVRFVAREGKSEWVLAGIRALLPKPVFVGLEENKNGLIPKLKGMGFGLAFEDIEMETKI